MNEIGVWLRYLTLKLHQARHEERGDIVAQVVLWGVVVLATIAIGAIVMNIFRGKAESLPTG